MSALIIPSSVLGLERTIIEDTHLQDDLLVVRVRAYEKRRSRCPICLAKCPVYDRRPGARRWRALDLGTMRAFLEADLQRVCCPEHGVLVEHVPWAAHKSRFTHAFERQVAWMAVHVSRSAAAEYLRIDWKSVGPVCQRAAERMLDEEGGDLLDGLERIGIDETSYKKGHKYLTVIVDHDSGKVVWVAKGHGATVLEGFYRQLGPARCAQLRVVSADGARWIAETTERFCPNVQRVMDPFHVVGWVGEVLEELRRDTFRQARKDARQAKEQARKDGVGRGRPRKGETRPDPSVPAKQSKDTGWALRKGVEHLSDAQHDTLRRLRREHAPLWRAWLLKEALRDVFKAGSADEARRRLEHWLRRACHKPEPQFKALAAKIRRHKDAIVRSVELGLSNARVEAVNNKIKLTVRMGYGFRNIDNLIALIMLRCSKLEPTLPGRD